MTSNQFLQDGVAEKLRRLKLLIIERFDSQANFSLVTGQQEAFVSRVLNGRWILRLDQRRLWADALNSDMSIFPDWGFVRKLPDGSEVWICHPGGCPPIEAAPRDIKNQEGEAGNEMGN